MNAKTPTVAERIGSSLRTLRAANGWDQASAAELLTALGVPTTTPTITRIESGTQPPTVEQLLLLSMLASREGLTALLRPPFTIGALTVRTAADLSSIVDGWPTDGDGKPQAAPVMRQYGKRTAGVWADQRDRQIAATLHVDRQKVTATATWLYGHRASVEINQRFRARLADVTPKPKPGTPSWRAYHSRAVRAVTHEIGEALQ